MYEFVGCYYYGNTCQTYRDVSTIIGDALMQRYERTMVRIEQITRADLAVEVQWECDFDEEILTFLPELKTSCGTAQ